MCCSRVKKTVDKAVKIATGYAYLAAGVNEELSEQRMKICNNCPNLRGGLVCVICGCEMHAKTRLPLEECPDKKNQRWLAVA